MFNFLCNTCILTEGRTDKKHPGQNLPDKRQNPRQNPREQLIREFVEGAFVRFFTRPTKNGGSEMCNVGYFWGVPGCVTKCDRGRGSKLAKNSVTYFMDSPNAI